MVSDREVAPAGAPTPPELGPQQPRQTDRRSHTDLLTTIREEQAKIGRHMTDSELDRFTREFYDPEYSRDLRKIMALCFGYLEQGGE